MLPCELLLLMKSDKIVRLLSVARPIIVLVVQCGQLRPLVIQIIESSARTLKLSIAICLLALNCLGDCHRLAQYIVELVTLSLRLLSHPECCVRYALLALLNLLFLGCYPLIQFLKLNVVWCHTLIRLFLIKQHLARFLLLWHLGVV